MRLDEGTEVEGTAVRVEIERFFSGRKIPDNPPFTLLVGNDRSPDMVEWYRRLGWGCMRSDRTVRAYEGEPWGLDNGAWAAWMAGRDFSERAFLERLEKAVIVAEEKGLPKIAVVPDKLTAGMQSLEFSLEWLPDCRKLAPRFPWFLALQRGMTLEAVEEVAGDFDGLLLGGARELKQSARLWKSLADRNGLAFHYAQVSTLSKLFHAADLGVDSADTAYPLMHVRYLRKFLGWWFQVCEVYGG